MTTINFTCPECGTKFEIKNSNGKKKRTAEEKLEALRKAGVDVSNYFSMKDSKGGEFVMRMENGSLAAVGDDDPVMRKIDDGGTIHERTLFRRWVMSQMFHMLASPIGFTKALQLRGYKYQWRVLEDELEAQAKMYNHGDTEGLSERNMWFDRRVAKAMAEDHIKKTRAYFQSLRQKSTRGEAYVKSHGKNVFLGDIDGMFTTPLRRAAQGIASAINPRSLYNAVVNFTHCDAFIRNLPANTKQCREFQDAYKGAGAYWTMKNLILFHGCVFNGMDRKKSEGRLQELLKECAGMGWCLLGAMKQFITDNGIDIEREMEAWKKK